MTDVMARRICFLLDGERATPSPNGIGRGAW